MGDPINDLSNKEINTNQNKQSEGVKKISDNVTSYSETMEDLTKNTKSSDSSEGKEEIKKMTEAVKKRRRSILNNERQNNITPVSSPITNALPAIKEPLQSSANKRRSVARRSLASVNSLPVVEDQVLRVVKEENISQASSLSQLIDISIRNYLLKMCHNTDDRFSLKSAVTIHSEQISEETVKQIEKSKIAYDDLVPMSEKFKKCKEPTQETIIDPDEMKYKKWLINKYKSETDKLAKERLLWKDIRRKRIELNNKTKKYYTASARGNTRIGEEQQSLLPPTDKAFIASRPDYSEFLNKAAYTVSSTVSASRGVKKVLGIVKKKNLVNKTAADRAYMLTAAASKHSNIVTTKSLLKDFHSVATSTAHIVSPTH